MTILFVSCNTETKELNSDYIDPIEMAMIKEEIRIKNSIAVKLDSISELIMILPIHGEINREELVRYFPDVTDTIKDLRIIGSEKIDLNTENGIIVSILHNTGTFDQMIICTHDSTLRLIDNFYIGKATGFDKTSHTIEYRISDDNSLKFDHVDWGYVKNGEEFEIDTVKHESYSIIVNENGKFKQKKH